MTASRRADGKWTRYRFVPRLLIAVLMAMCGIATVSATPATAAPLNYRIDLRVLVLDDGSSWVAAIKSQMTAEGVPFDAVPIATANVTAAFLTGSAAITSSTRALYQAVVVPDHTLAALSATERTVLRDYEAKFGIRQVNAWENDVNSYSTIGLGAPTYDGMLDGVTAQVSTAGKAGGFGYLNGPVPFGIGSFGHIAPPLATPTPAGATYTSFVDSSPPAGGASGSILGVYSSGGVEQMVITPGFGYTFLQFKYLGHGIITWMTRGVHFGYNRNNFTFHADDAFGEDATWNVDLNCTPGEDCVGPDAPVRMTPADVTFAVQWMQANGYQITLPFNGSAADTAADPLTQALVANKSAFRWLNHSFQHLYQGCVQNVTVSPWVCTVDAAGQTVWVSQATIYNDIHDNITRGQQLGLSFNPSEYLSGEHSGLQFTSAVPGQTQPDNPNFVAALAQAGIARIGADASREATARPVGTAMTIPRHPTALYYNAATRAQAVDEYNWFYAAAPAGSGACGTTAPPCITPLTTDAQFDTYIVPTDAAFNLGFILSNDPRPLYAHVTNLTGDRLAYPWLDAILSRYRSVFTPATPVVNLTLTQAADQLVHQQQWATDGNVVTGFVQNGAVTITNSTGHAVPFTGPAGTTINGASLESYGGEQSAWLPAGNRSGALPAPGLVTAGGAFLAGQPGSMTFTVAGAPTASLSITSTPALPAGVSLTQTPGGPTLATIAGTAGTTGTYTLSVAVTSAGYNNVETATLTVASPPLITSATTASGVAGRAFSFNVTTSGFPAPAITMAGALPAGITLVDHGNGTATIAGTAPDEQGGRTYPITLSATNAVGAAGQSFTLALDRVPQFTSAPPAAIVADVPTSFSIMTVGSPTPVITETGALPPGLTFKDLHDGTATISGTAPSSAVGPSFPITLTATNAAGVAHQSLTLAVTRVPQFTSATSMTATPGEDFAFVVQAAGSPAPIITMTGTLPDGVRFASLGNGQATLSGTPDGSSAGRSYDLNFTATNSFGSSSQTFTLTVETPTALVSLTPARLADTRPGSPTVDGQFAGGGIRPAGSILELQVAGRGGVPSDAAAVALNVTVDQPAGSGYVTVFPCGSGQPLASSLNFTPGSVVPNAVIARLGGGKVCLFVSGSTQLIVDVNGYFPAASTFSSMNPARMLDTRPGGSTSDGSQQGEGMPARQAVTALHVTGRAGIPTGAEAVVLNVTVTDTQAPGYVTVYPCGGVPNASNLNFGSGATIANMVIARIAPDGDVCIFESEAAHLVVDVDGYFPGDGSYGALTPARLLETRSGPGLGTVDGGAMGAGLLPPGTVTELTVAGRGDVPLNATSAVLNVTAQATSPGFITVYPCGTSTPTASNLNYGAGTIVAGAVITQIPANGKVCLFNYGATQLVVDVNGYLEN